MSDKNEKSAVPQDVAQQKEDAYKMLEDFKKVPENTGEPTPTPPVAPAAPPAEPPKPEDGKPAPEPTPEPAEVETLKQQNAQLLDLVSDLRKALSEENNDTWKHKYDVLNGMIKAKGPRDALQMKELKAEVERLKTELAAKPAASQSDNAPLTEEEQAFRDEMGIEDSTFRRMKKLFAPPVQPAAATAKQPEPEPEPELEPEPAPAATQGEEKKVDLGTRAFLLQLSSLAPGWDKAVNSEGFKTFIVQNRIFYDALKKATDNRDAEKTAEVYNYYFKSAIPAPVAQVPKEEKPSREAAPSSSKGGSSLPEQKQKWTVERVRQFDDDVRTGKIPIGSEEYKKLKAERDESLSIINIR